MPNLASLQGAYITSTVTLRPRPQRPLSSFCLRCAASSKLLRPHHLPVFGAPLSSFSLNFKPVHVYLSAISIISARVQLLRCKIVCAFDRTVTIHTCLRQYRYVLSLSVASYSSAFSATVIAIAPPANVSARFQSRPRMVCGQHVPFHDRDGRVCPAIYLSLIKTKMRNSDSQPHGLATPC